MVERCRISKADLCLASLSSPSPSCNAFQPCSLAVPTEIGKVSRAHSRTVPLQDYNLKVKKTFEDMIADLGPPPDPSAIAEGRWGTSRVTQRNQGARREERQSDGGNGSAVLWLDRRKGSARQCSITTRANQRLFSKPLGLAPRVPLSKPSRPKLHEGLDVQ